MVHLDVTKVVFASTGGGSCCNEGKGMCEQARGKDGEKDRNRRNRSRRKVFIRRTAAADGKVVTSLTNTSNNTNNNNTTKPQRTPVRVRVRNMIDSANLNLNLNVQYSLPRESSLLWGQ